MKKLIIAAIAATITSTAASAAPCGFLCKLAYGSHAAGGVTAEEAEASWLEAQKSNAAEQMAATGKSVAVIGNYVYVGAAGEVAAVKKQDLAGKSKAQVKAIIVEAVTTEVATAAIDGALEGAELEEATKAALVDAIKDGDQAAAESLLSDLGIDDPASLTGDEAEAILGADVKEAIINATTGGPAGAFDEAAAQAADEAASKAEAIAEGLNVEQIYDDAVSAEDIANGTAVDPVTGAPIN